MKIESDDAYRQTRVKLDQVVDLLAKLEDSSRPSSNARLASRSSLRSYASQLIEELASFEARNRLPRRALSRARPQPPAEHAGS